MNTGARWPTLDEAEAKVLGTQAKLHQWATDSPDRRFDDLFNLVCDPCFLTVAWDRVRGNRGAGVDGVTPRSIGADELRFLTALREELKARRFRPLPVRQRMIPKANGKLRSLGIPTARDRVVQASVKLVPEPIFETDFHPCSYGFRPGRRPHDAIAEIHMLATNEYSWVLEGDIKACFDEIDHSALMERVRRRVGDKRVLGLVKAFLHAGVLSEDGVTRDTKMGTPQGGILSPLLANIALSVLDDHFAEAWQRDMATRVDRARRRSQGGATYRLVRYADDFVVMVSGTKAHAEGLRDEVAAELSTMGLRLSEEKTMTVHIDEGFDFLGFRIQRQTKRGSNKAFVYTWPSKKSLTSIKAKAKAITRQGTNHPLSVLLRRLNGVLRGWTNYFRHGVSKATFAYLHQHTWLRVVGWLRRKHRRANWRWLRRRYLANRWWPEDDGMALFDCRAVSVTRYRYRGDPHAMGGHDEQGGVVERHGLVESRMRWKPHVRSGGRAGETDRWRQRHGAPVRSHVGNRCLDKVRRRVQNETLGHRGRKHDPLYRIRKLLFSGHERLNEAGHQRMNRPGSDGGSGYWIPNPAGSACWAA